MICVLIPVANGAYRHTETFNSRTPPPPLASSPAYAATPPSPGGRRAFIRRLLAELTAQALKLAKTDAGATVESAVIVDTYALSVSARTSGNL